MHTGRPAARGEPVRERIWQQGMGEGFDESHADKLGCRMLQVEGMAARGAGSSRCRDRLRKTAPQTPVDSPGLESSILEHNMNIDSRPPLEKRGMLLD